MREMMSEMVMIPSEKRCNVFSITKPKAKDRPAFSGGLLSRLHTAAGYQSVGG